MNNTNTANSSNLPKIIAKLKIHFEKSDKFREEIEKLGIDAEFHIIGLGLPSEVEEIFEQLSGATGGFFENISPKSIDGHTTKLKEKTKKVNSH